MIYIIVIFIIQMSLNGYLMFQIYRHEIAIVELLKKHPDMLIGGDENDEEHKAD